MIRKSLMHSKHTRRVWRRSRRSRWKPHINFSKSNNSNRNPNSHSRNSNSPTLRKISNFHMVSKFHLVSRISSSSSRSTILHSSRVQAGKHLRDFLTHSILASAQARVQLQFLQSRHSQCKVHLNLNRHSQCKLQLTLHKRKFKLTLHNYRSTKAIWFKYRLNSRQLKLTWLSQRTRRGKRSPMTTLRSHSKRKSRCQQREHVAKWRQRRLKLRTKSPRHPPRRVLAAPTEITFSKVELTEHILTPPLWTTPISQQRDHDSVEFWI